MNRISAVKTIKRTKQKIVWAIDPFEDKSESRSHVIQAIRELAKQGAEIRAVYVLSPDEFDINVAFNSPWLKQVRPTAEKVLQHFLKDIKIEGIFESEIIIERRPSLTRTVRALVSHAERIKADTIVVGTHAKKGVSRFFLGSFAETLLAQSSLPVLVVGPHSEIASQHQGKKVILFPTDFGSSASATFKKIVTHAKIHQASIILFHCLPHPMEAFAQSGIFLLGGGYITFPDYLTQDEQNKQRIAARFVKTAKTAGVHVKIQFSSGQGSVAQSIVDLAQGSKVALIAIAAVSGPISATLVGSVTRQVVRSAPCPVWAIRV